MLSQKQIDGGQLFTEKRKQKGVSTDTMSEESSAFTGNSPACSNFLLIRRTENAPPNHSAPLEIVVSDASRRFQATSNGYPDFPLRLRFSVAYGNTL